jgi:very-short-patch-repair endonuclease
MSNQNPFHDESMWRGASNSIFNNAKQLRLNMTEAEKVLWEELRKNKLEGYKFRRQHPIQNYIADFYCHALQLVIEIDGENHLTKEQIKIDIERTEILNSNSIDVIRYTNQEVLEDLEKVIQEIKMEVKIRATPPL